MALTSTLPRWPGRRHHCWAPIAEAHMNKLWLPPTPASTVLSAEGSALYLNTQGHLRRGTLIYKPLRAVLCIVTGLPHCHLLGSLLEMQNLGAHCRPAESDSVLPECLLWAYFNDHSQVDQSRENQRQNPWAVECFHEVTSEYWIPDSVWKVDAWIGQKDEFCFAAAANSWLLSAFWFIHEAWGLCWEGSSFRTP